MKKNGRLFRVAKKHISVFLAALFTFASVISTVSGCGKNELASAVSMRLQRMVGIVHLFDDKGKEKSLQEQMRLLDGDKIDTDAESLVMVSLDETKLVTMEENASADILGSGKKLVFKINEGNVFINVTEKLAEGESFDVQTSNMICGIRGTSLGTGTDAEGHEYVYATDGSFVATATDEKGNTTTAEAAPGTMLTLYKGAEADNGTLSFGKRTMTVEDLPAIALDAITKSKALKERIVEATGFDEKKIEVLAKLSSKPATTMYGQAADDFKKEGVDDSMPLMGEQAREMTASAQAARDMSNGNFEVEVAVVTGCRGVLDAGTGSGYSGAALSGLMNSARNSFKKVVDKAATDGLEGDALTDKVNKATEELQKTAEEAVKENKTEEEIEKALDEKAEELAEDKKEEDKPEEVKPAEETKQEGEAQTENAGDGDTTTGNESAGNTDTSTGTDNTGTGTTGGNANAGQEGTSTGSSTGTTSNSRFTDAQIEALRSIFDAEYYASLYPDVVAEYGNDPDALFKHFLEHGINEARNINPDFNVSAYKSAYGDLAEAYGDNIADYYLHYAENGKEEGRDLTTVEKATEAGVTVKDAVTGETISIPEAPPADPGTGGSGDGGSGDSGSGSGGGGGNPTQSFSISVGEAVHGSIDVTRTSSTATYNAGTSVTVYFAPDSGYILSSDNITITDATGEPVARSSFTKLGEVQYAVSFTMPSSNVTVSAVFTQQATSAGEYTISADYDATMGTVTVPGTVSGGGDVTVTVTPNELYKVGRVSFKLEGSNDEENLAPIGQDQNEYVFNLSESGSGEVIVSVEFVFDGVSISLTEQEPAEKGTVTIEGGGKSGTSIKVSKNAKISITATPASAYKVKELIATASLPDGQSASMGDYIQNKPGSNVYTLDLGESWGSEAPDNLSIGIKVLFEEKGQPHQIFAELSLVDKSAKMFIQGQQVTNDGPPWDAYYGDKVLISPLNDNQAVGEMEASYSLNGYVEPITVYRDGVSAYFIMPNSDVSFNVDPSRAKATSIKVEQELDDVYADVTENEILELAGNGSIILRTSALPAEISENVEISYSDNPEYIVGVEPQGGDNFFRIIPIRKGETEITFTADDVEFKFKVKVTSNPTSWTLYNSGRHKVYNSNDEEVIINYSEEDGLDTYSRVERQEASFALKSTITGPSQMQFVGITAGSTTTFYRRPAGQGLNEYIYDSPYTVYVSEDGVTEFDYSVNTMDRITLYSDSSRSYMLDLTLVSGAEEEYPLRFVNTNAQEITSLRMYYSDSSGWTFRLFKTGEENATSVTDYNLKFGGRELGKAGFNFTLTNDEFHAMIASGTITSAGIVIEVIPAQ